MSDLIIEESSNEAPKSQPMASPLDILYKDDEGNISYTKVAINTTVAVASCAAITLIGESVVDLVADLF